MTEEKLTVENEGSPTDLVVTESLPVVVEKPLPPRRAGLPPAFWTLLGAGLGVACTLAIVASKKTPPRKLVAQVSAPNAAPGTSPTGLNLNSAASPTGAAAPGNATPGATLKDVPEAPLNPFGGSSFVLPKAPGGQPGSAASSAFHGLTLPKNIPTLPPTNPAPPTAVTTGSGITPVPSNFGAPTGKAGSAYISKLLANGVPKAPAALKAPSLFPKTGEKPKSGGDKPEEKSTLVTVNQLANDRQGAADDLIEYVKKIGGKAQPLTEEGSDGKPEVKGVLATVPQTVVDDLLKHVADAGAVVDKQTWSGSSTERKSKLVEDAQSRIASLKKLREALLVTYLEDAQPVKDVDEEIAKANKSLEQLQTDKAADKMAIVRISFVNKS